MGRIEDSIPVYGQRNRAPMKTCGAKMHVTVRAWLAMLGQDRL